MPAFELVRRAPPPHLAAAAVSIADYRECGQATAMVQSAALVVPLIVSIGTPFAIALSREPAPGDAQESFAAGLHAGPVHIRSDGGAAAVQLDLHPVAAFRLFGPAIGELKSRMVPLVDVFGRDGRALIEQVGNAANRDARIDALVAFVAARLGPAPSAATLHTWHGLVASGGMARIEALATSYGVSRKHLSARFAAETGIGPKTAARLIRFARARRLAARRDAGGWAGVAAAAGFADQAHLTREFAMLAGATPTAWDARLAADPTAVER